MNVASRGIRNAFRNLIRSFSIIVILGLSIGLSLTMLIAHQAVSNKISSVKASVGNTVTISPAGARGFEGGGNALTETEIDKVASLSHVTAVSKSLSDRLTTSNTSLVSAVDAGNLGKRFSQNSGQSFMPPSGAGDNSVSNSSGIGVVSFTPPVIVNGTTGPTDLSSTQGGGTFTLKSGKVFANNSTDNVALVGSTLATKNNLKVGSTFTAYGTTITVAGIFDAGNTFSNNQVIMPLATVQKLSSQTGDLTSATLTVDSITNVDSVTSAAEKALGSSADVTNAAAEAKSSVAPLENIQTISLYSLVGAVIAGSVIILLTMVMIVRERRREIGVTKAIGASNITVMLQFAIEAITLTILGAVVGIALGFVAGKPITNLLVTNSTSSGTSSIAAGPGGGGQTFRRSFGGFGRSISNVHATIGWTIILEGLVVAVVIGAVGSILASFFIAKIRPAEVMRVE